MRQLCFWTHRPRLLEEPNPHGKKNLFRAQRTLKRAAAAFAVAETASAGGSVRAAAVMLLVDVAAAAAVAAVATLQAYSIAAAVVAMESQLTLGIQFEPTRLMRGFGG